MNKIKTKWLGKGIKNIIESFEHDIYIIQQDFEKKCTCVDFSTDDADPGCKKCFGLGYKIKIKKIRAVSEDKKATFKNASLDEASVSYTYFINSKYEVYNENVIVDNGKPLCIYRIQTRYESDKDEVFHYCVVNDKKNSPKKFMELFNEFMKVGS